MYFYLAPKAELPEIYTNNDVVRIAKESENGSVLNPVNFERNFNELNSTMTDYVLYVSDEYL